MINFFLAILISVITGWTLIAFEAPKWAFYLGMILVFWLNLVYGELLDQGRHKDSKP